MIRHNLPPLYFDLFGVGQIELPAISQVTESLWMGGCIDGERLPDEFVGVVSLHAYAKYELGPHTVRHQYSLIDGLVVPDPGQLDLVSEQIATMERYGPVLVHCQAGLNRSGLLVANTLIQYHGYAPQAAIDHLRKVRSPHVLCNFVFEKWLLGS